MAASEKKKPKGTPWHLWLVGILALLWNSMGAMDYVMTETENESYLSKFTEAQLDFFYGLPTWVVASWATAVWGGVLGSLLLLARKRLAVFVFLVSLVAMMSTTVHNYGFSNGMEVMGDPTSLGINAAVFACSLVFFLYARAMKRRGAFK
ncbi:MAG: hypothetical protein ACI8QZ_003998 [Chlamydiales bacterium]|jgi:hypothetical protein